MGSVRERYTESGSFWAQFAALCRKNYIIFLRRAGINFFRCFTAPILYAVYFANARRFFRTRGQLGEGSIGPLQPLSDDFLGRKFVWVPPPQAATNETAATFYDDLMDRVLAGTSGNVVKLENSTQIEDECPENLNALSECFVAVVFENGDLASRTLNYTLRGDFGLGYVDVVDRSKDDVQRRYLPMQWAIDSNFITMATGTTPQTPYNWEYTNQSNQEFDEEQRISYLRGIRSILVLAMFLIFLGVGYQIPGSIAAERTALLTSHLGAMGCRKSAITLSWLASVSSFYFPAWVIQAIVLQLSVFKKTNIGLLIVIFVLTGVSLGAWSMIVAVPFAKAPTLASVTATLLAILLSIVATLAATGVASQIVLTLLFPPMFFIFSVKGIAAFEIDSLHTNIVKRSPRGDAPIIALIIVALIAIVLYPTLSTWLEAQVYNTRTPDYRGFFRTSWSKEPAEQPTDLDSNAVEVHHLRKEYSTKLFGLFGKGKPVVAIEDLSFSVPKGEISCLLGRNGAAKSTALSAIARLLSYQGGRIKYAKDQHVGIASQKDVLWDDLSCKQHVALWCAIKNTPRHLQGESDLDLLARCDLSSKADFLSKNLSGGQKRKLQLACALAGGSNLLLLDEISSGLDPLSRRAIWKLIIANRGTSSIIFTTHSLDEADYLGDHVAILQAPGKLLALDSPVHLKTTFGKGYTVSVGGASQLDPALIRGWEGGLPGTHVHRQQGKLLFQTGSTELGPVQKLVRLFQAESHPPLQYQVNGSTLEDVFLDLNNAPESLGGHAANHVAQPSPRSSLQNGDPDAGGGDARDAEKADYELDQPSAPALTPGQKGSQFHGVISDVWTIFLKRLYVLQFSWLLPLIAILLVIGFSCVPLFFIRDRVQTCAIQVDQEDFTALTYPRSLLQLYSGPVVVSPPDLFANDALFIGGRTTETDNSSFVQLFENDYRNLSYGGVSLDTSGQALFAWEGSQRAKKGPSVLNLVSNALLNQLSPSTNGFRISLNFEYIPSPDFTSTGQAMKWLGFFGLGISLWPAFAVVYPSIERSSRVRQNQYSNGASPLGVWLGHLLFEMPAILFVSTVIIIIFAVATSQFSYPGALWACFVLFGITGSLWSFVFSLGIKSALVALAAVAGYNLIFFILYLAAYLLVLTFDRSTSGQDHLNIVHFTMALVSPLGSIIRAVLVSVNLFNLLCDGQGAQTTRPPSDMLLFGAPIVYLIVQGLLAFGLLIYNDSGYPLPRFLQSIRKRKASHTVATSASMDVVEEKERIERGSEDSLKVVGLKKRFREAKVSAVDDVTFGVKEGETFALIGPNGAGKTTALACIRGSERPTGGDVTVSGHSIVRARNAARGYLGVCEQYNAIDANLTVRQHLWLYGKLKGVPSQGLKHDIAALLHASNLSDKADDLATSLSGGNQRKLSLAMALIGDRPVVLIDEFSSGVDPFSKREAWAVLSALTKDRAVVMTTHSMEEVDALSSRVGILAAKLLAVGTPESLKSRFATYEIHLSADEVDRTLAYFHSNGFEGAKRSMDTLTRISIPGVKERDLDRLLGCLSDAKEQLGLGEVSLQEASTETAFLEIVRQHNIQEEESRQAAKGLKRAWWKRMSFRRAAKPKADASVRCVSIATTRRP